MFRPKDIVIFRELKFSKTYRAYIASKKVNESHYRPGQAPMVPGG
jgi:hypothetical protein